MAITDPLLLPTDVVLLPVEYLPANLREHIENEDGDYVLTRPHSRLTSCIIDAQTAILLKEFQVPRTIVEAVINYSRTMQGDPEQILDQVFPLLQRFIDSRLLVVSGSEEDSPHAPTFNPGDQVADCEIVRCTHVLDDTEVYQVKCHNGVFAALKIARPNCGEEIRSIFDREIAILNHLHGSVSPALLETGTFEDRQYILMEWCGGVNAVQTAKELRRHLEIEGREKLLHLCCAILDTYSRLHQAGVIHADIHPGNLLIARDTSIKIIDFGYARRGEGDNALGQVPRAGVAYYFEPEYALACLANQRPPQPTMEGEQYALAALLYFLLTGTHYLNFSLEQHEMLRQIAEDQPLPFSRQGLASWPEVEEILGKALSKKPEDRFPSVAAMADRLREFVIRNHNNLPVTSEVPSFRQKAAEELLDSVLHRTDISGPLLSFGLPATPIASVTYGAAGIAYSLYRIACLKNDAALLSLADIWSTKAANSLKDQRAFYNDDIDITPEIVGSISPYHTASGVYCVQACIANAMGDSTSQQAAIDAFVSVSRVPCENLDLTLGLSGRLLACSLLVDLSSQNDMVDMTGVMKLGDETFQVIWDRIGAFAPLQACPELELLGIAHGWAGILYATLDWCQLAGRPLPATFAERLQQLAECAEDAGRGVRWKWGMQKQGRELISYYMPGWCNGSAGFIFLWTFAHQMLGNAAYLNLAERAAWNAWEDPAYINNLCCGLAGRAYGLLNLYRYSGEKQWLYRAQELAGRAALSTKALSQNRADRTEAATAYPHSLYKGEVGIAVLVADLSKPEESCMPFFERERWHSGASGH